MTIIASIIVFLLVIIVHEFGHFAIAKTVGIRVNEFSIGMGPTIFNRERGETLYSLRLLPIGGYVAMEGEEDDSEDERGFSKASVGKRMAVVFAGAFMNFLLGFITLLLVGFSLGMATPVVEDFAPDSPAQAAGLATGDRIIEVGGLEIKEFSDLGKALSGEEAELPVVVERNGEIKTFMVKPTEDRLLGISGARVRSIGGAFIFAGQTFIMVIGAIFSFFGNLFKGQVSLDDVGGPVAIVSQIGAAAKMGMLTLMMFSAMINIQIGFFNLLPIPALDGSKIVILAIEGLRGKPIPKEKEGLINLIGLVFLLGLILLVTLKDILGFLK